MVGKTTRTRLLLCLDILILILIITFNIVIHGFEWLILCTCMYTWKYIINTFMNSKAKGHPTSLWLTSPTCEVQTPPHRVWLEDFNIFSGTKQHDEAGHIHFQSLNITPEKKTQEMYTLPSTNSLPLKIGPQKKRNCIFRPSIFRCYRIFTYIWLNLMANVGKYTSPMDPMLLSGRVHLWKFHSFSREGSMFSREATPLARGPAHLGERENHLLLSSFGKGYVSSQEAIYPHTYNWLVVEPTPLKNVKLGIFPNFRGEHKKSLKPPPSICNIFTLPISTNQPSFYVGQQHTCFCCQMLRFQNM